MFPSTSSVSEAPFSTDHKIVNMAQSYLREILASSSSVANFVAVPAIYTNLFTIAECGAVAASTRH